MLRKKGFKRPTIDEVRDKQAANKEKFLKAPKVPKLLKNIVMGQKQPKKRKKKTERQTVEEKLWDECKRIIRLRYDNVCYTCGAQGLEGVNWQTGHGKPKGALPIRYKYDLRNLRPQCMRDNIHLGGLSDLFIAKLEKEPEGLEFLQESCRKTERGWIIKKESELAGKDATLFLQEKLAEYKKINC